MFKAEESLTLVSLDKDIVDVLGMKEDKVLQEDEGDHAVIKSSSIQNPREKKAIKKLLLYATGNLDMKEKRWSQIIKEFGMMKSLRHPNIVTTDLAAWCPGYLAVIMEYISADLEDVLPEMTAPMAHSCFSQLTEALCYLHGQRIAHGDLKLANALISDSGLVKLCDFGHAQKLAKGDNWPDYWMGTLDYFPPERYQLFSQLDAFKMDKLLFMPRALGDAVQDPPKYRLREGPQSRGCEKIRRDSRCAQRVLGNLFVESLVEKTFDTFSPSVPQRKSLS